MMKKQDLEIVKPSQPTVIDEDDKKGTYEIEGLYPGYGHTLGNSLRRIILSSLSGSAVTAVKIEGVNHEFSTLEGVKEDVITILLNIRKMRMKIHDEEPQKLSVSKNGEGVLTAGDMATSNSAVEIVNPDQHIATLTDKKASINIEVNVEKGLGFVTKDELKKDKVDIGNIAVDAAFTPIRRVTYEVENMRVGDRTDFNKLRIFIETDGTITPREAIERSINIMIEQLQAIVGFRDGTDESELYDVEEVAETETEGAQDKKDEDFLKTSIENIGLSSRTSKALSGASIRTVSGLIKKSEDDLLEIDGLGEKGVQEIKDLLNEQSLSLKEK
ncbi:MAG: DNA-directed RNA polymerase subunit alpha [Candidatus Paceibacterota bacterium]